MKRLDLVVGSNGAGKTTFVTTTLQPLLPGSVFVNADEIAKLHWPHDPVTHSYDAAKLAAATRARLLDVGASFISETVFSHPSKLTLVDDAHERGYVVVLHVLTVPEELAVLRVKYRVESGGHSVPEAKIRERYQRLWSLIASAIAKCNAATAYDNSQLSGPRVMATFKEGMSTSCSTYPVWVPDPIKNYI